MITKMRCVMHCTENIEKGNMTTHRFLFNCKIGDNLE